MATAAAYSYKPAEGDSVSIASTVVPLKKGGFLEVRRGEKTKWAVGEARRTWTTLEEWKATLPAGAVIVEKGRKTAGEVNSNSWTPDFRMAYEIAGFPRSTPIIIDNNKTRADKLLKSAANLEGRRQVLTANVKTAANMEAVIAAQAGIERIGKEISKLIDRAREVLAAPPFERHYCYNYSPVRRLKAIKIVRSSDMMFIPIFFDTTTGTLHSPASATSCDVGCKGKTFKELGVIPIFFKLLDEGSAYIRMPDKSLALSLMPDDPLGLSDMPDDESSSSVTFM